MSFVQELRKAQASLLAHDIDPWRRVVERALPANVMSISTVALLDLLDVPRTTGNCRRLALTMRAMGWVGLKSRRLAPGGWRTTTCRGWTRSFREINSARKATATGSPVKQYQGERIEP